MTEGLQSYQQPPNPVTEKLAGTAPPPVNSLLSAILAYQKVQADETAAANQALNAMRELLSKRLVESKGVFSTELRHRPTADPTTHVLRINLNTMLSEGTRAVTILTAPYAAALDATPQSQNVYIKFGRNLSFNDGVTIPVGYDIVFPRGGKVEKFRTPHGIDNLTLFCQSGFDGAVYVTAGNPDSLPDF